MSDQPPSAAEGRRAQFEEDIAAVRIRTGKAEAEQRYTLLGLIGLGAGLAFGLFAYFTSTGTAATNDILELVILAMLGVNLSIIGAALFLRYSVARFLRFWLLRLIYESKDEA